MPRRARRDLEQDAAEEEEAYATGEEEAEEVRRRKRSRVESFIDDAASEDDDEEEEEDEEEYEGGRARRRNRKRSSILIDDMAEVDDDDGEEEEDGEYEDGFIDDARPDILDKDVERSSRSHPISLQDEEINLEEMERIIKARFSSYSDYVEEETTEVEQQALLPSVKDPKLWMVKCAVGHERETAVCLMQKVIDRPGLQITSVVALDHLKNNIYVEAMKESHVKEACKGLRNIFATAKVTLVPIREMADVLSVESKAADISRDKWARMKSGVYKGDIAKVVDVDNVRQRVTVKLIPRVDLHALANKSDGLMIRKKLSLPPPRFFSVDEARGMNIRVSRRRNRDSGEYFDMVDKLMFKDGFLYKTASIKSISTQYIQPSLDELEKFIRPGDDMNEDLAGLSTLFANRKKGHFMKDDAVIVIRGDLKNLEGFVEKVEDATVHIRPKLHNIPNTLTFDEKDLCKYFNPGDHVKVVSSVQDGVTGMVVKVEGHILTILSDTTKEHTRVFADHVESSEVSMGITKIGDYELHDLVLLNNLSFGVIIRVESEAFQVLKGVPDKPQVVLVKLREIKSKIYWHTSAKDWASNTVSTKDVVSVIEGPCKGKRGLVEHIHKGVLFIYDHHHLEHSGFICANAQSCLLAGVSSGNRRGNSMDTTNSRFGTFRSPARIFQSPRRLPLSEPNMNCIAGGRFGGGGHGGRGHDALVSRCIKIKSGPYKGYHGRVKEVNGALVRVELDSLMKIVTVKRVDITDTTTAATPFQESRYSWGGETPMHPAQTPLCPIQTPMRDPGATPIHDGMRTPMHSRAWAPMSPPRDNWEDGNPGPRGSSPGPAYQPGTPLVRSLEAPTPGSGWVDTPAAGFVPSTPIGQPMTPHMVPYMPNTPGPPMTPGIVGMDIAFPITGDEDNGSCILADVWVTLSNRGDNDARGVVKEVLPDGSYRVQLDSSGSREEVIAFPNELEVVRPNKNEKLKILYGPMRGVTGKLIGADGSDGIVRLDDTLDVKIVDLVILGKLST